MYQKFEREWRGELMGWCSLKLRMLNDLERDVDDTTERMNFVMGKLSQLLKTKGESGGVILRHDSEGLISSVRS